MFACCLRTFLPSFDLTTLGMMPDGTPTSLALSNNRSIDHRIGRSLSLSRRPRGVFYTAEGPPRRRNKKKEETRRRYADLHTPSPFLPRTAGEATRVANSCICPLPPPGSVAVARTLLYLLPKSSGLGGHLIAVLVARRFDIFSLISWSARSLHANNHETHNAHRRTNPRCRRRHHRA